jgi:hypothetical protein
MEIWHFANRDTFFNILKNNFFYFLLNFYRTETGGIIKINAVYQTSGVGEKGLKNNLRVGRFW